MDQLQVGQLVTLELDGAPGQVACVVTALTGETATLVHAGPVHDDVSKRLHAGSGAFLVVGDAHSVLGLRGAAIMMPESHPLIDFVLTEARAS